MKIYFSQYHLQDIEKTYDSSQIFYKRQTLTQTLAGNKVPVLTITSHPQTYDKKGIEQLSQSISIQPFNMYRYIPQQKTVRTSF